MPRRALVTGEEVPAELVKVTNEEDIEQLAALVLEPTREQPVVCLTSRPGEADPALDPCEVREVVGDAQPIWLVPTGPLTRELERRLPPKLHVFGGAARIWWPGVTEQSDPRDHPLVQDRYGVYGTQTMRMFEERFARGAPQASRSATEPRVALLQAERDAAQESAKRLAGHLSEMQRERDSALERAASADRRRREERAQRFSAPLPEPSDREDEDAAFHRLLLEAWLAALSVKDRTTHPLRPYVLGPAFLEEVRQLELVTSSRVARVCAMVACGRAHEIEGLSLHPLRAGAGGDDPPQIRDRDGARAMRCALKRNTPSAPHLHFWQRPDGVVEFASVGGHDDFKIQE